MRIPAAVRKQNEILKQELGAFEGHALYQWAWSESLIMPMVILADDPHSMSRFETDVLCDCGRNKRVHTPECKLSRVVPKWEMKKLVPDLHDCWVFCRWVRPPDKADWEASFGGDAPYPSGGYLAPFSDKEKQIYIRGGAEPYEETTWTIIHAIQQHREKKLTQWENEFAERAEKREKAYQERLEDQVRDSMTPSLAWPGKKDPIEGSGWGQGAFYESKPFGGLYGPDGKPASGKNEDLQA